MHLCGELSMEFKLGDIIFIIGFIVFWYLIGAICGEIYEGMRHGI